MISNNANTSVVFIAITTVVILWSGASAFGQSRNTGALAGVVQEDKTTPLPGASVQLSSDVLIGGIKNTITDTEGMFRFPDLPPGEYRIAVTLAGYKSAQVESIRIFSGRTAEIAVAMTLHAGEETVIVEAGPMLVDPGASSSVTTLTSDYLQNIPTDRDTSHILNLAAGINNESAYGGGSESGNSYQVDGVDISDPQAGSPWSFYNFSLIEEVQVIGLGAPAEYGQFTGAVINTVTKSGGNGFSGSAEFFFSGKGLTASDDQYAGVSSTIEKYAEGTLQIGGPIVKDRLWYFASGEFLRNESSEGGPIEKENSPRLFSKFTWKTNKDGVLNGWLEWDHTTSTGRDGDAFTPLEATTGEDNPEVVGNLSWNTALSENSIVTISWSGYSGSRHHNPHNGFDVPGHVDAQTGVASENAPQFGIVNRNRNQLNASLSYHTSNFLTGYHDLKFGTEIERSFARDQYGYPGGAFFSDNEGEEEDPSTGEDDFFTLAFHGGGYDASGTNRRISLFAQDSWRLTPRLTLNPGIRLDINRGSVPGSTVFKTNPVAPRIGFAFDLTGEARSILKGHYGRYYEALYSSFYYYMDPGAFFPQTTTRIFNTSGFSDIVTDSPGQLYAMDASIRQPRMDQLIIGVDHQLPYGILLSGTIVYRRNEDLIETVSRDGQFTPVTGLVPGTGQQVTLFEHQNAGSDVLIYTNPEGLERTYKSFLLSATRLLANGWQLQASYVYSRTRGNIDNLGFDEFGIGGNTPFFDGGFLDTPNSLVNADGRLTHDQTHQVKLQGTWLIPNSGFSVSTNYTFHSGDTWTPRTDCLLTDDGNGVLGDGILDCHEFPQGPVSYFAEPRGSRRLPARNEIDLRLEWEKDLRAPASLQISLDIFNLTNQRRATEVESSASEELGQPATVNFPRSLRIGLGYSW